MGLVTSLFPLACSLLASKHCSALPSGSLAADSESTPCTQVLVSTQAFNWPVLRVLTENVISCCHYLELSLCACTTFLYKRQVPSASCSLFSHWYLPRSQCSVPLFFPTLNLSHEFYSMVLFSFLPPPNINTHPAFLQHPGPQAQGSICSK